jgi:hypothetical protein
MLKILSILLSLLIMTLASAKVQSASDSGYLQDEEILQNELSNENQSKKEFKNLVKNTIDLMGPYKDTDLADSKLESSNTAKN